MTFSLGGTLSNYKPLEEEEEEKEEEEEVQPRNIVCRTYIVIIFSVF